MQPYTLWGKKAAWDWVSTEHNCWRWRSAAHEMGVRQCRVSTFPDIAGTVARDPAVKAGLMRSEMSAVKKSSTGCRFRECSFVV